MKIIVRLDGAPGLGKQGTYLGSILFRKKPDLQAQYADPGCWEWLLSGHFLHFFSSKERYVPGGQTVDGRDEKWILILQVGFALK